ncbi:MAG: HYR domain-containing protein [Ilumatobacter sp.]
MTRGQRSLRRALSSALITAVLVAGLLPIVGGGAPAAALRSELGTVSLVASGSTEGTGNWIQARGTTTSATDTTFNVRPIGGTAMVGLDYEDFDADIIIRAGETRSLRADEPLIQTLQDDESERFVETIEIGLFDPTDPDPDAAPLATATFEVVDDDPVFEFTRPAGQETSPTRTLSIQEPESGMLEVRVPMTTRLGELPYDFFGVDFAITDLGDATTPAAELGSDLTVASLSWNPDRDGPDVPDLVLQIAADDLDEGTENIRLALGHSRPCDCGWVFGTDDIVEIAISDPTVDPIEPIELSTSARNEVVTEGDDPIVTVRLVSPTDGAAQVRIATVDAGATAGPDYKPVDVTVDLDATNRFVDVTIDTATDLVREQQFEDIEVHVFHLDSGEPDAATEPVLVERILIEDDEPQTRFEREVLNVAEPAAGSIAVSIPVTELYTHWPFESPLPSDDPEFDPTLGVFVDLRAEFVNPSAAATDAFWMKDTVRLAKGEAAGSFIVGVRSDTDTDIEQLEIRLIRTPRLAGFTGQFVDDTTTLIIGPQVDNTVDPADELRTALAELELSFPTWTPPDLDLDLDGAPIPVIGDPGEVFDFAAELVDVAFQNFDPDADDLDAALDDFEAKGCVTDFVAGGVGGRKAATDDDVVQITCESTLTELAPTAIDRIDTAVTDAFEQFITDPELDGELDVSADVTATVTVGIDAAGVYVAGNSAITIDAEGSGTITATSPTDATNSITGTATGSGVTIGLVLERSQPDTAPERIRLADLDERLAEGPGVTIDGEVELALDVSVGPLDLAATYAATIATGPLDPPKLTDDRFTASGTATFDVPGGDDGSATAIVTVAGVVDDGVAELSGTLETPDLDLFGIAIAQIRVETRLTPAAELDLGVDFDLAIDASGWGANAPVQAFVRTRLVDGDYRGQGQATGDRLELGGVELTDWEIDTTIDTKALPTERFSVSITAASLDVRVDDATLITATGITGSVTPQSISLQLETGSIGADDWPFSVDVSGLALSTPDDNGIVLRAATLSATVSGFGENVTATVSDLVIDSDFRVSVSSLVLDRGDLEQSSSVLGVIPIQLQSIGFDFERDSDGFIPDLGRFTITTTATIPTDAFDGWPVQPVITLGGATIGPDTPADERQLSLSARVLSVDPLQIAPVDVGPIGIGVNGFEVGGLTIDATITADGYIGGELQPGLAGSITVDTGVDVVSQVGAEISAAFVLDDSTGAPIGLLLGSRFTLDLDLSAAGFGVVVDDLALDLTAAFGAATDDGSPAQVIATGIEAAKVDFELGDFFDASATDIVFDLENLFDGSGVLLSIGGDLATEGSGATLRVGDAFGGFDGWGGVVGNVGITAGGQLVTLDGFFIGVLSPDSGSPTTLGLPDWLPVEINEIIAGFGTASQLAPFDIAGAGPNTPVAVAALGNVEGDDGFAPIDLPLGTAVDAALIGAMKLQVSAKLGGGAVPAEFEVERLRVDLGALLNHDFTAPLRFDDLPIENLDSISARVAPIDLGAVRVGGGIGFGSTTVSTPDGDREVLYLELSGLLESEVVSGETTMIISEVGPVLLRVTAPLGLPIGPTGFVLSDVTGAATFGDVLLPAPDLGEPEQLLGILDGSLPTDVALGDDSISEAIEAAVTAGTPTWEQGGAIAVSGRLTHLAVPGLAEGDVTLAAAFGPQRDGGIVPGTQIVGTGDISVTGIDLFGVIDGGEVARTGVMIDLSSPTDPRFDVAFESPTATSPLALLFPASLTAAGQLDLTGVVEATEAGFAELVDTAPAVIESIAATIDANPDSALGQALAALPSGTLTSKVEQLLATDPLVVINTLLTASQADLVDVLTPIRAGARQAILAADTVFDPSFTFRGALQPTLLNLPIGDPAAEVGVIINKDAIAFQASGSLIESTKLASSLFVGSLPGLLFELSTLDMTDRTDFTVQIPLPDMQEVLLAGGDLPVIDPAEPTQVGADPVGPDRFAIQLTGNLSVAGSTMQFGGFYTAPNNQAVLDRLVQKRFELPADAPVDPLRIALVDRSDYDNLLATGGFVLSGRALVPRVVTDPVGVIADIGPLPNTPLAIGEWFAQTGDAVTGVDDPISAVLVIPTPPSPLGSPPDVVDAWDDWSQTVTFTGVFDGTARTAGGDRNARLLSLPLGTGQVRATIRGIEVTSEVPLAGAEATFVVASAPRPTGSTNRFGDPILEERWGAAVEVTVSTDAAVRNALTAVGLPPDWAPDRAAGLLQFSAFTPGFDLSSTDPIERVGGVRAEVGVELGGIVDGGLATIDILPGAGPSLAAFLDPDFSLEVSSDSVDLVVVELSDVIVELGKSGSSYTGRVSADVELGLPGLTTTPITIDQSFAGSADLQFGIDREISFLGQDLDVDLDVAIINRVVSINGSASGELTIGGVPLASGGFDVALSDGVLKLTIPDDDPISGRVYGIGGFEVSGSIDSEGGYSLETQLDVNGSSGAVSWNGTAAASVTRRSNGTPLVQGEFTGTVTAGGLSASVTAAILNRSDGRGLVIGSVTTDLDGDGDTNGYVLPSPVGVIPESAPFSFVLGLPAPVDVIPPVFGAVPDITVQVSVGTIEVPVHFEPPTAFDGRDGNIVATCDPTPGSMIGVLEGDREVSCSATDVSGNTATTTFTIEFIVTEPISVELPGGFDPNIDLDIDLDIEGNGDDCCFQPGIIVQAVVFSDPVSLGSFQVDDDGSVSIATTIPQLDPGLHHLVLFGRGLDGNPLQFIVPIGAGSNGRATTIDGIPVEQPAPTQPTNIPATPAPTPATTPPAVEPPTPASGLPATGRGVRGLLLIACALLVGGWATRRIGRSPKPTG